MGNEFLKGVLSLSPEQTVSVKSAYTRDLLVAKGLAFTIGAGAPKAVAEAYKFRTIPLENIFYAITVVTNPLRPVRPEVETYISLIHKQFQK